MHTTVDTSVLKSEKLTSCFADANVCLFVIADLCMTVPHLHVAFPSFDGTSC